LEASFLFGCIEDILDTISLDGAELIFDYLESRAKVLTAGMEPGKGKGLILLRFCNALIRRLSKV
jgi:THO complex subunit 1